ncbi:MAG: MbtH family protein [Pseudonocardiales bacterium]|nr:MAG: MbtH family protein [Pseudonocardiales bacterium]
MTEPLFRVVCNDEEQYSIWAADRELPAGWYETGFSGSRADCLSHVDEVWTDMRPRSLRAAMAGRAPDADGEAERG